MAVQQPNSFDSTTREQLIRNSAINPMLRRLAPFAADLWTQRELLWQFTLRNVEMRHKGSHLGLLWTFLSPLLMLGLYFGYFSYVAGSSFGVIPNETKVDFALGVFIGLTFFQFVAEVLGVSPYNIVSNPNFVKKVVFPLEVLPASAVGAAAFHMLVSLTLVLLSVQLFGSGLHPGVFLLPVIIVPIVLLCLGIGWFFAALGVFFRDIGLLMQFLTMSLMFSSAVFNSASRFPPAAWVILRFNPVMLAIELARDAVLWQRPLNPHHLVYLYATGIIACYLGHLAFRNMKPAFADVL